MLKNAKKNKFEGGHGKDKLKKIELINKSLGFDKIAFLTNHSRVPKS